MRASIRCRDFSRRPSISGRLKQHSLSLHVEPLHSANVVWQVCVLTTSRAAKSKVELQCKLNQARIVARRRDAAEVAWIDDLTGI